MYRAYVIPLLAILTFVLGSVSVMLPFLPFGWALYALTALILMPYIKPLRKVFMWVADKDGSGTVVKIGYKIVGLYRWSYKADLAREVSQTVQKAEENGEEKEAEQEEQTKKPATN